MKTTFTWLMFFFLFHAGVTAQEKLTFKGKDGLLITADLYRSRPDDPYLILCHLAGHSRGEYKETAIKFNTLGYNCLALDARSGDKIFGIVNETAQRARQSNKSTGYLDAIPDIESAIHYADSLGKHQGVLLLGSSYSASLVLIMGKNNNAVKGILAFSPGEYFGEDLQVKKSIKGLDKPSFVTSSKKEASVVQELVADLKPSNTTQFIPEQEGAHGSIALWSTTENNQAYWKAVTEFLNYHFKR